MPPSPLSSLLQRLRGASDSPAGPLAPGTRLGSVRIERLLARGASGALYLALDEADGTPVAVKALPLADPAQAQATTQSRERFLAEAQNAIGLRHPGIVASYSAAALDGVGYLAMELLPGTDLSRYTRPGRLLPEPLALEIAASLAQALAYAHREGVVHRDVKPANVMFDPATQRVKLTDFGLARGVDAQATRSGVLLGSPAYMAPELLAGARADARSDLYALGVLLFELLTGRLPFEGASMGALLRAMATQVPQSVQALRPDLPAAQGAALDAVLAPVLARDPAGRLADGDAWARALRLVTAPGHSGF